MAVLMQRDSGTGPIKSRELEIHYIRLMRKGDRRARDRLVESQMGYVHRQASKHRFGAEYQDMVQQGVLGILRALEDFDPARGNRLGTYALPWIKAFGLSYAISNKGPVKIPGSADVRSLVYALNRVTWEREAKGQETTAEAMSEAMGVPRETIERVRHFLNEYNVELDNPDPYANSPEGSRSKRPQIAAGGPSPEEEAMDSEEDQQRKDDVLEGMAALTARERKVIALIYLGKEQRTLAEVGRLVGLSRERVRQIEMEALAKMREVLG